MTKRTARFLRRAMAALLVALVLAPCALAVHRCKDFGDVPNDWSRAGICAVTERGLMQGTSPTTFAPNAFASRAMLVTVLYRMEERESAPDAGFSDVAAGQWYTEAVNWAAASGVVNGYPDGTFQPNKPVTRQETAAILARCLGGSGDETALIAYRDASSVLPYARGAMAWCVQRGIINGTSAVTLSPTGTTTRAQLAVILARTVVARNDAERTLLYLEGKTPAPRYGDEWLVADACAAALPVFSGCEDYYDRLAQTVRANGGTLNTRKATDYARAVIAVTALGRDARSVGGADLTAFLCDGAFAARQGVNGVIYALIALDSGNYPFAGRDAYVQTILDTQRADGGFSLSADQASDADLTAMALQALAPYRTAADVRAAVERAVRCLSQMQLPNGGFATAGVATCESTAQVLLALAALGIAPDDVRFVKNGNTALDALARYRFTDGSYCHVRGGESDLTATEQALRALLKAGETA